MIDQDLIGKELWNDRASSLWKESWARASPRPRAGWQALVSQALSGTHIFVFDGQLFHGDFTSLFLIGCPPAALHQYVQTVLQLARPLHLMIIYCYQDGVAQALDRIGAQRGGGWVESQVAWKVASPYGQQRGLAGIDGWKQLYRDYRQVTDTCLQSLSIPKIEIETSAGEWSSYQMRICKFLELPFLPQPVWQRWFYKLYDYLVDIR